MTSTLDPRRTIAELKELRQLTADANGAQKDEIGRCLAGIGKANGAGLNGHSLNGHASKMVRAKPGILAKPARAQESRASA